jgi:hypothetical protein
MGAAYLCAEAGISPAVLEIKPHTSPAGLRSCAMDRRLAIHAASQAQRARRLHIQSQTLRAIKMRGAPGLQRGRLMLLTEDDLQLGRKRK